MSLTLDQYNQLQLGTTAFTMLAKVTATADRGSDVIRVALASRDVTFESEVYKAVPFDISEFELTAGTSVDNATFSTALASTFNRLNIKGGKWQGAEVVVTVVDIFNLGIGYVQRQRGRFGQATIIGREAQIEFRGLMQLLSQEIGDKTSRLCRYQLGVNNGIDSFCPVNIATFTHTGTVTAVTNKQKFTISVSQADRYFYRGRILWTSGANSGLSMETSTNVGTLLTLFQPMIGTVGFGDAFSITRGDDKTLATCHNVFDAAEDFGAEGDIPERETLYRFPD